MGQPARPVTAVHGCPEGNRGEASTVMCCVLCQRRLTLAWGRRGFRDATQQSGGHVSQSENCLRSTLTLQSANLPSFLSVCDEHDSLAHFPRLCRVRHRWMRCHGCKRSVLPRGAQALSLCGRKGCAAAQR